MNKNRVKHYSPNVVYVLRVWGTHWYVGAHTVLRDFLTEKRIIDQSGNLISRAYREKLVTRNEMFENLELFQIEEFETREDALNREAELIQQFKEQYGKYCLNQSFGNKFGITGLARLEDTKQKISETCIGRVFSEEHRKKLSEALKGRIISEETRKKIAEAHGVSGVLQYSKGGELLKEYYSIAEAESQTGIFNGSISKCCKGQLKTAGGYIWRYAG